MEEMEDLQILVCDDSALMRNLISKIIDSEPGMKTAATAMNGRFALQKLNFCKPDAIIMDIEMPEMNGIEFLQEAKKLNIDIPVIILSSIATKGAAVTMQCLELGASDFITKPNGSVSSNINQVANTLIEKIASYGGTYARKKGKKVYPFDFFMHQLKFRQVQEATAKEGLEEKVQIKPSDIEIPASLWKRPAEKKEPAIINPLRECGQIEVCAIGISTGGPNALREVFSKIAPDFEVPILVVQHMPAGFTKEFAASLDRICPLEVKEAQDGDIVKKGRILIAPGDYHIYVEKKSLATIVRLSQDEQRNGHRPSADVLFESVAQVYKNNALGVIMTGMGRDGASALAKMRKEGAWTLGQDEKTSIVYGMPKVAWELGAVQKQVSLENMAGEISSLVHQHHA